MDNYIVLMSNVLSPTTLYSYKRYTKKSFADLRSLNIKTLSSDKIQFHYAQNRGHLSPKTIHHEHSFLSVVLIKYLGRKNPCSEVVLPKKIRYLVKTLSDSQIEMMLEKINGLDIEVPILLAMWCGLRLGEVVGLRWQDIDFDNKKIFIQQTMVQAEGGHIIKKPKSFSVTRVIHLPQYVENKLNELKRTSDLVIGIMGNIVYTFS